MTIPDLWPEFGEYKTITLDKIELSTSHAIRSEAINSLISDASLTSYKDCLLDQMVYTLKGYIWGEKLKPQTIRYPRDWRQAFKERWFPAWALKRWPVLYTVHSITATALYPDFKRAMSDERCVMDILVIKDAN